MPKIVSFLTSLCILFSLLPAYAAETDQARVNVIVLAASNKGNDFDLANDEYRDQLIKLFSYTSYKEKESYPFNLQKTERQKVALPGGYELVLTLQDIEKERILVQAVIRKDNKQYVDTVLSILNQGVVFLGGPPIPGENEEILIIVLETGF